MKIERTKDRKARDMIEKEVEILEKLANVINSKSTCITAHAWKGGFSGANISLKRTGKILSETYINLKNGKFKVDTYRHNLETTKKLIKEFEKITKKQVTITLH